MNSILSLVIIWIELLFLDCLIQGMLENQILDIYWACKSRECDKPMQQSMWEKYGAITHWVGLDELAIPAIYMRWVASHFSRVQEGKEIFADDAFKKFRLAILCVSQIVVKETTPEHWEQIERLPNIPSILGGLDFS